MSALSWRLASRTAVALLLLVVLSGRIGAQNRRTVLTVSGLPLSVTNPTATDFEAGSVSLGSSTFSVDLTTNVGGGFPVRVTTVNVRCQTACPNSGTLPVSALQWRRSDLGTWNTLTTGFALVETRTATFNGTNDPWSNSIFWRYLLSWTGTPPTAATQFRIDFQLVVTAP
ncbi:hypothetical protein Strain138_001230 [Pseudogemmatithrix spongiicola]|uniref:Uncharacterized protein n=1 Tax=Pseudogemmatithrix spongiicola TaxID=3062599 RepID=A0AA49JZS3_9BACT|nr:hypothetical protein Strain138_001230 [Gemmatimonadaceae bacterium 'strain 138']WKW14869.1 hypothetical protein Strain318_001230 [Gemmatimonadaceae bacterium 'strain 318']